MAGKAGNPAGARHAAPPGSRPSLISGTGGGVGSDPAGGAAAVARADTLAGKRTPGTKARHSPPAPGRARSRAVAVRRCGRPALNRAAPARQDFSRSRPGVYDLGISAGRKQKPPPGSKAQVAVDAEPSPLTRLPSAPPPGKGLRWRLPTTWFHHITHARHFPVRHAADRTGRAGWCLQADRRNAARRQAAHFLTFGLGRSKSRPCVREPGSAGTPDASGSFS
jgi:hypothetical protein